MSNSKSLKVGYVLKRYPRYSETFILNEILAHEAEGLNIEIFSLYAPKDTHFQNAISSVKAPVNYLFGSRFGDFWTELQNATQRLPGIWTALEAARGEEREIVYKAILLAQQVKQKGITHLHAHFGTSAAAAARLASLFTGVPYTFTAHAKDIFHEDIVPELLQRKFSDAGGVVTVSEYNVEYLSSRYDMTRVRLKRIYNGLDLTQFPYQSPQSRPLRIVFVGRLVEKKGVAHLIDACSVLATRKLPFECLIIGSGELEEQLRAQVERLGLQTTVKMIGPRPQREIIKLVQEAAVFAAPCVVGADGNRDGLPTVLLEAMALGTPCVSTSVTGIPEVIQHEKTGLIVPQHDAFALAAALQRLLENPALRVKLAGQARKIIENEFDIHRNAGRIRQFFAEIADQKDAIDIRPLREVV